MPQEITQVSLQEDPGFNSESLSSSPVFDTANAEGLQPFVSVVIPVFNHAAALEICLDCLGRQTYPSDRFEIVVVDNGSDTDLAGIVEARPGVSLIHCPTPGSYAARNRGQEAARGSVLAFTDADCRPRQDWLESGVTALAREPEVAVLGGRVEIFPRNADSLTAAELHQQLRAFPQKRYLEQYKFVVTANMLTYRRVFERVGPFDERLLSSGDFEWGQRAHSRGHRLSFCPDSVVAHPARATIRSLVRKSTRIAGGQVSLRRIRKEPHLPAILDMVRSFLRRNLRIRPHAHLPWYDRARFLAVEWVVLVVSLLETLRLLSGGSPRRH